MKTVNKFHIICIKNKQRVVSSSTCVAFYCPVRGLDMLGRTVLRKLLVGKIVLTEQAC
jgi:predicted RNA-binding Zn-ribbon protein involved in translation (DUF1610 family)